VVRAGDGTDDLHVSIPFPGPTPTPTEISLGGSGGGLPFVVVIDDSDTPYDMVDALALTAFTRGEQPWARGAHIDRPRPDASLLPAGGRVVRAVVEESRESRLAVGEGWTVRAVRDRIGAEVTVTAVTDELARAILDEVTRSAASEPASPSDAPMGFWYLSSRRGPVRTGRRIATVPWAEIRDNYAADARDALDTLMATRPDRITGRLVLLHGPSGTGKTTLLRAMAHEWRDWCRVDCVLDPESLFSDLSYLVEVAIGEDETDHDRDVPPTPDRGRRADSPPAASRAGALATDPVPTATDPAPTSADPDRPDPTAPGAADPAQTGPDQTGPDHSGTDHRGLGHRGPGHPDPDHPAADQPGPNQSSSDQPSPDRAGPESADDRRRWRLLVIEDCDELIRGDGRGISGSALSRLLNLTDGLVGQGRDVLVALTTNEDLSRMHPAVVRPGRCLAQIEIGPLPRSEAADWLGGGDGVSTSMTIAELFALRDGVGPARSRRSDPHSGLYL
jgi:hypothetical protein